MMAREPQMPNCCVCGLTAWWLQALLKPEKMVQDEIGVTYSSDSSFIVL